MARGTSRIFREKVSSAASALGVSGGVDFRRAGDIFIDRVRDAYADLGFSVGAAGRSSRVFREQVELANAELGIVSFAPQTFSIDFDGNETMANAVPVTLGIANTFTIAIWFRPNLAQSDDNLWTIRGTGGGINSVQLLLRTTAGIPGPATSIQLTLQNQVGTTAQNVAWTGLPVVDATWHHAVLQWNSLAGRAFYFDGVNQGVPGFIATNNDAVLLDTAGIVEVAGFFVGRLVGRAASLAMWNSILTGAEVLETFNAGSIAFNLAANSGNYVSAATLQHWNELGKQPSPLLGADAGIASVLLDLEAGATNISDADRVADVP